MVYLLTGIFTSGSISLSSYCSLFFFGNLVKKKFDVEKFTCNKQTLVAGGLLILVDLMYYSQFVSIHLILASLIYFSIVCENF